MATAKKISELDQIKNISLDDLFLISDYDNNKCISKKMTMKQLANYISQYILQNSEIQNQIKDTVNNIVQNQIEEKTMNVVSENIEEIADLLDGENDDQVNINAGSANSTTNI